ncbi:hypothetical protein Xbed_03631 [Xenorhabdus beddingii]|uniref:Uncharacterized protein n=1 Tax=Xenorhabdus beddingii TaxID=40578 RepID=A0A1Y2S8M3_9GAMM|nr:hypothetical protein Xbed_03631 [Xenorhabdus beddingii]
MGAILLINCRLVQPLGSMPRDWSSLRSMRLIHVAREASPSVFACSSSCCLNSSVNLIWYCGDRFSFCIRIYPNREAICYVPLGKSVACLWH